MDGRGRRQAVRGHGHAGRGQGVVFDVAHRQHLHRHRGTRVHRDQKGIGSARVDRETATTLRTRTLSRICDLRAGHPAAAGLERISTMSETGPCKSGVTRCGALRRTCRGAVAVEFALVFLIFFALFYAIVAYGFVLTLQQSLTLAAEEGASAALQDAPNEATRFARAEATAKSVLDWVPEAGITVTTAAANCVVNPATRC